MGFSAVKNRLDAEGFGVSSIGSPIGKIGITDDFEPHLETFERAIHVAKTMGVRYIRIFSFYIPAEEDPAQYRVEVVKRMAVLVARAEKENIVLLHDNEKLIYGETEQWCLDILERCDSPFLRLAFHPANFLQSDVRPMVDAYPLLEAYIE